MDSLVVQKLHEDGVIPLSDVAPLPHATCAANAVAAHGGDDVAKVVASRTDETFGHDSAAEQQRGSGAAQAAESGLQDETSGGGGHSNTHPHSSHVTLVDHSEWHVSGGYDWLEWSASVRWHPFVFDLTTTELEWAKETCRQDRKSDEWMDLADIGPVRVFRTGINRGGDRGQHFEYKLSYRGVCIALAKRGSADKFNPNVYVCLGGRECLLLGAREGYEITCEFIEKLGGHIECEKLSRADFCVDIAGLDVGELQSAVEQRRFVTRARSVLPYCELVTGERTGFEAGKRPLHLVVYDKPAQTRLKSDQLYLQALIDRRWGGRHPEQATRIEFQASRLWLLDQGVDSPGDLFRLSGAIVEKLTREWFRLTEKPVDRDQHHQTRAQTAPLWLSIREAFMSVFGKPEGRLAPIRRSVVYPERLVKQGRGCLASALLQKACTCQDYDEFVANVGNLLQTCEGDPESKRAFIEDFQRRASEHAYDQPTRVCHDRGEF